CSVPSRHQRSSLPDALPISRPELPLVVEVETLDELREALAEGCDRVLIDDFDPVMRREAVAIARGAPFDGRIPLEVSGGVEFDRSEEHTSELQSREKLVCRL